MFTELENYLDTFIDAGIPGYDCIVYHKGNCVFRRTQGVTDIEKQTPMNGKEKYYLYSCSKVITCVAALQLYEKGLFDLEDDLCTYLPEFEHMKIKTEDGLVDAKKKIKIHQLFSMTAGFSYNITLSPMFQLCKKETDGKCPTRVAMQYLAKEPLLFEPGEDWEYSLCHDVLAALVEVVSGVTFEEYVQENIFKPLKMNSSTYMHSEKKCKEVIPLYRFHADTKELERCAPQPYIVYVLGDEYASGGAGCISTVEDYIKFLEGLRIGKLLKSETLDLMTTDRLTEKQRASYSWDNYGYGLGVRCPDGTNDNTDFGWGGAAASYLWVDRENEISGFYAQHVLDSPTATMRVHLTPIVKKILTGHSTKASERKKNSTLY